MIIRILLVLSLFSLVSSTYSQSINQGFHRDVVLQRIKNGRVVQEHIRKSRFVRDDQGRLVETVLYKTPNLKGMSDADVEEFADGKDLQPRAGVQMLARYYRFKEFKAEVEVKDFWDIHWPKGSQVKVYFSADFRDDLPVLLEALSVWNSLIPEIRFDYAGTAEAVQICEGCLTVLRNPTLKVPAGYQQADRGDGLTVYGLIQLRRLDRNSLFSVFAHEIGHSLGLSHSDSGLMREDLPKGKMVFPTKKDAELVTERLR